MDLRICGLWVIFAASFLCRAKVARFPCWPSNGGCGGPLFHRTLWRIVYTKMRRGTEAVQLLLQLEHAL